MTNPTTAMGVFVLMIGVLGILGWVYAYNQISGHLSTLATIESGARTISSIPFIGGMVSGVTTPTADFISSIRTTITIFFFYNVLLNIALIFSGLGLVSIGRDMSHMRSKIRKVTRYLLKRKSAKI